MPLPKSLRVLFPGFSALLVGIFLLNAPAAAIEGMYRIEGRNPAEGGTYTGEAQVKQTGRTFAVIWKIGELRQIGTGIVVDNVLSVVFQSILPGRVAGRPGIAVFQIDNDRITNGIWSTLGDEATGQEIWTASDRP
jgi:hypothetical protein